MNAATLGQTTTCKQREETIESLRFSKSRHQSRIFLIHFSKSSAYFKGRGVQAKRAAECQSKFQAVSAHEFLHGFVKHACAENQVFYRNTFIYPMLSLDYPVSSNFWVHGMKTVAHAALFSEETRIRST